MNGIIINDELHELVSLRTCDPCDNCSLQGNCDKTDFFLMHCNCREAQI